MTVVSSSFATNSESGGDVPASLRRRVTLSTVKEQLVQLSLFLCAFASILTTVAIVYILITESWQFFSHVSLWSFLTGTEWAPRDSTDPQFGVLPLLSGTLLVAFLSGIFGLPLGLLSAIYLSEYAAPRMRNIAKPLLELLAGIPTVVYGYFAVTFITPWVLRPVLQDLLGLEVDFFNALSGGIVVGIMILPTVSSLSEDALRAVPGGLREAAYALGSTKLDVSVRVVVPAAFSGIVASFLLAMARAIGETMAVVIACGQQPILTLNPLSTVQTMTAAIVGTALGDTPAGSVEYQCLYAIAITLFVITLSMNIVAQYVMRRFREVYQ